MTILGSLNDLKEFFTNDNFHLDYIVKVFLKITSIHSFQLLAFECNDIQNKDFRVLL